MPSAIRDAKPPVAISMEPTRALSELPQFFDRIAQYPDEFIIHDNGFRGFTFCYPDIAKLASRFRTPSVERNRKGDAVVIWSESRPGWIAALWGCLLGRRGGRAHRAAIFGGPVRSIALKVRPVWCCWENACRRLRLGRSGFGVAAF